ncbi:MAG: ATP-binding cassette domain-containing protein, partial [Nanoarchaeota archaeon]|nr:ATP-binding cassette domain-containing protein [Nanoarchaeota archaeon]
MISNILLNVENLSLSYYDYTTKKSRVNILNNINFSIPKKKVTTLVGGNGTGKTTLFNCITGFISPDNGSISFYKDGIKNTLYKKQNNEGLNIKFGRKEIIQKLPHEIAKLGIKRQFQDQHIFPNLTILENMLVSSNCNLEELPITQFIPGYILKKEKHKISLAENIFNELFGSDNEFWSKKNYSAKSLSYGQQRLLGFARLLMDSNLSLVLLDEPTAGIEKKLCNKIIEIIQTLVKDKDITIFLIEHDLHFIENLADNIMFINGGEISKIENIKDIDRSTKNPKNSIIKKIKYFKDTEPICKIENLIADYNCDKGDENAILKSINLSIFRRQIIGIMGLNGSGKSTLVEAIVNSPKINKLKGKIIFNGNNLLKKHSYEIMKNGINYLP